MSLPKVQVNLLLFLLFGSFAPCQTPTQPLVDQESQHSPLRVPDGTMVVLRFAEPLVGVPHPAEPFCEQIAKMEALTHSRKKFLGDGAHTQAGPAIVASISLRLFIKLIHPIVQANVK